MFVYSVKASSIRFLAVLIAAAGLLGGILFAAVPEVTAASADTVYRYDGAGSEEGRRVFLRQFGWESAGDSVETVSFTVPAEFDRVMLGYNEIQRAQGLDLSRYKKKSVTRYTYEITNCTETAGKVYANLIVYRGRVIAGDISSADPTGFVHGFEKPADAATG